MASYFGNYGEIEDIEVFEEQYWNKENRIPYCAYVTFKESRSAYLALIDPPCKRKNFAMRIIPADIWGQPTDQLDNSVDERNLAFKSTISPIAKLNDDFLVNNFNYLDLDTLAQLSDTCLRFDHFIHKNICCRYKSSPLDFGRGQKCFPYRNLRRDEVSIKYSLLMELRDKSMTVSRYPEKHFNHPANLNRIMDIIAANIVENFQSLTINGISLTKRMQTQFLPTFGNLKYFEWNPPLIKYTDLILLAKSALKWIEMALKRCELDFEIVFELIRFAEVIKNFDWRVCDFQTNPVTDILQILNSASKAAIFILMIDQQIDEKFSNDCELRQDDTRERELIQSEVSIMHLNDDCLIAVFEYLDLEDLCNVIEINQRFKDNAVIAFSRQQRSRIYSHRIKGCTKCSCF